MTRMKLKDVYKRQIHTRARTKRILKEHGAKRVCGLDDIMNHSIDGSGYNENFGLLGSNKSCLLYTSRCV